MSEAEIKFGADIAGSNDLLREFEKLRESSEDTGKAMKTAFAADVLSDGIGRIADQLEGLGGVALKTSEAIVKGFLAGGPLGAVFGGASMAVAKLTDAWSKQEEAARKAQEETRRELAKTTDAIAAQTQTILEAVALERAVSVAKKEGLSIEEARLKISGEATRQSASEYRAVIDGTKKANEQLREDIALREKAAKALTPEVREVGRKAYVEETNRLRGVLKNNEELITEQQARLDLVIASQFAGEAKLRAEGVQKAFESEREARNKASAAIAKVVRQKPGDVGVFDSESGAFDVRAEFAMGQSELRAQIERDKQLERERERQAQEEQRRIKETRDARIAAVQVQDKANAEYHDHAAELEEAAKKKKSEDDEEAAKRAQGYREQALNAAIGMAEAIYATIEGNKEATKEELLSGAKKAAFQAAFQGARALGELAIGNVPGAISAGLSAAQFAALAAANGVASQSAPTAAVAKTKADSDREAERGSRSGRGGGRGGSGPIIVNVSAQVLTSGRDAQREIERALAAAQRSR